MSKIIINPPTLAPPRGFNHGILTSGGRLLFLAGQDAGDASGRIVAPGDLLGQFEQVLRNLRAVVEEAGGASVGGLMMILLMSELLPFFPRNAHLSQDTVEHPPPDVTTMRVGD